MPPPLSPPKIAILNARGRSPIIGGLKSGPTGRSAKSAHSVWAGATLLLLLLLPAFGGSPGSSTGDVAVSISTPVKRGKDGPFILFPITKWYPTRPRAEASTELLTLALFLAVPCVTAAGLRKFYRRTRAVGGPAGFVRLAAGNALLLLCLLSVVLLACEVYYRFFVDTTDSLGFTKISERWITRHWRTNAAGCRDSVEYAPKIQPGKRRVTFVGDSFTAGHGLNNVETRCANRLRALHPDWEVHVLANVGLDTAAEIKLLNKAFYRGYELDEVVLVYCLNDVGDLLTGPGGPFEGRLPSADQVGPWFTRGSYFLDLFYNRYQASKNPYIKDYFAFTREGYRGEYWEKQQKRLKEFRDLVQSHGGHLSVVTYPFLHALGPNYSYGFVHEELARCWSELGIMQLDLLPVYEGCSSSQLTVNSHDAHPNERANRLAADAIERVLWPKFRKERPKDES